MDHINIIKRAFNITRFYRALWIFGFVLALTTGNGSGGSNGGGSGSGGGSSNGGVMPPGTQMPNISWPAVGATLIPLICMIAFFVLLIIVVTAIARYVSETALIRMVNEQEETGEQVKIKQGIAWGWSRAAFRLFLIDLILGFGGFLVVIFMLLLAASPLLLWLTDVNALGIAGTIAAIGMGVLVIFAIIILSIAIKLLTHFIKRAGVLEDLGVADAFRRGFELVRTRLLDIILMGLILFGIGLVFAIVMIPIALVFIVAGAILGGAPGLIAGLITSAFAEGVAPWIVGVLVGLPLFLALVVLPLTFVSGLMEVFYSSTWTLTYREMVALESISNGNGDETASEALPEPELDESDSE